MKLFTYGYNSYPIERVVRHLVDSGVRHVVDVRFKPYSRNPDFRSAALHSHLTAAGIRYTHIGGLGNVNYKGGPMTLADASKIGTLRELVENEDGVCILCVCAQAEDCHRRMISDTLQGIAHVEVVDL